MSNCCNRRCPPSPDFCLVDDLKSYVCSELCDSKYFYQLASLAPTKLAQDLLIQFSIEDQMLANTFMRAVSILTCKQYCLPEVCEPVVADYCEGVKRCLLKESADAQVYGQKYLEAVTPAIRDMFFRAMLTENQHAVRLALCLCEGGCCAGP